MSQEKFTIGPMRQDERGIIADSWVESFKSSERARLISLGGTSGDPTRSWRPSHEYFEDQNGIVNLLLEEARFVVARDDHDLVAGFVCWEPWENDVAVHYLYVRLMHRKKGVARLLAAQLPTGAVLVTHRARGITKLPEGWRYSERPLRRRRREAA